MGAQIAISGKSSPPAINAPQKQKEKQWIRNAAGIEGIPFIDATGAANTEEESTEAAVEAFL